MKMLFREAVLALTYRCNSRCVMCNIWKAEEIPEVEPKYLANLPASLKNACLSGGEPFSQG